MSTVLSNPSLVSVIIPTYNYGEYLPKAINSVLTQTYPNLEVIVIDDGSTDNTYKVIEEYKDDIIFIQQANQGASAARNRGLNEANGDYICFLDADDSYLPDNIAEKILFLEKHKAFDWCYSNWAWVDESGKEVMRGDEPKVSLAHIKAEGDVLNLALQGYRLQTNMFMFRESLVNKLKGFDTSLKVLEDYDYFVRAAALGKLGFVDKVLCHIYQHEDSLGTGCDKETGYRNRWILNRKLKRLFADKLQQSQVQKAWRLQQADLYRNLAVVMLARGATHRAYVLLNTSLQYQCGQLGAIKVWLHIMWARIIK